MIIALEKAMPQGGVCSIAEIMVKQQDKLLITDGYSQHGTLGSLRFVYRPALDLERRCVLELLRFAKDEGLVRRFVRQHIVWWRDQPLRDDDWEDLFHICMGVIPPETGGDWAKNWESRDARNLYEGVILETGPARHFAQRSCVDCKKWWYDDETGKVKKKHGKLMLRPEDTVLLCQTHDGCPKGTPEKPKSLSPKNRLAWRHYRDCKATGQFPDDPIVRHNARIIERALQRSKA